MLIQCGMKELLKLSQIDILSFIVSAACHDLGHDGFSNGYHVNAHTKRAIESNGGAVQEIFHAAEMFRILNKDKYNFVDLLSKEDYKMFKKRSVSLILATDMSIHTEKLKAFNELLNLNKI